MNLDSPALFAVDSSGLALATAVRVAPDRTQTPVPVFDCSSSPCKAVPIDTSGDPIYLSVFATGLNYIPPGLVATNGVYTTGFSCQPGYVTYAGPQGYFPGLQQINMQLIKNPKSDPPFTERISCGVGGTLYPCAYPATSNTVYVSVK